MKVRVKINYGQRTNQLELSLYELVYLQLWYEDSCVVDEQCYGCNIISHGSWMPIQAFLEL